jgi:nucleoside-diphosphate-sugar epimerase
MITGARLDALYRGVPVVVLGAAGFIGRWVVRALTERGARVIRVVRSRATAEPVWRTFGGDGPSVEADLAQPDVVDDLLATLQPAIVFNLAGYGVDNGERDPAQMHALNRVLVERLCDSRAWQRDSRWSGLHLVHAGSALEYGAGDAAVEGRASAPHTPYGQTKLAASTHLERCVGAGTIRAVSARLFTVYGPGEHQHRLLPSLMTAAASGTALALTSGAQSRDFTYVEDVADAMLRLGLAAGDRHAIVNVATGRLTTVRDFALTARQVLGLAADRLTFGALPVRPDETFHDCVDVERLRRRIGSTPSTTILEGIQRTHDFHHVPVHS